MQTLSRVYNNEAKNGGSAIQRTTRPSNSIVKSIFKLRAQLMFSDPVVVILRLTVIEEIRLARDGKGEVNPFNPSLFIVRLRLQLSKTHRSMSVFQSSDGYA